ncbi:uncharacterized protein [Venturia canescens]|uniref:uncharacterized protein n=1 Tax=Venturia canescens TaxID=32260 RepID=UPI001C9C2BDA|nr:uncharacterized protein LOC122411935 [Venturia canescens]XP_043277003.1 uncharacterized protein LOC122411935 [Venturia canescens]
MRKMVLKHSQELQLAAMIYESIIAGRYTEQSTESATNKNKNCTTNYGNLLSRSAGGCNNNFAEKLGYRIVREKHQYAEQMFYRKLSWLGLDQAVVEKLLKLGYDFIDKSFLSMSQMEIANHLCQFYKQMEAYSSGTEEVVLSPALIVLRSISALMVMGGYQTKESEEVLKWLKTFIYLQSVETLVIFLLLQLISILKVRYESNGKSINKKPSKMYKNDNSLISKCM